MRIEKPLRQPQCPAGPQERLGFKRVFDLDAKARAIAQAITDLRRPMADAKHEPPRALIAKQRDLDLEKRPITHRGQALGPIGDNAPAAASPARRPESRPDIRASVGRRAHTASLRSLTAPACEHLCRNGRSAIPAR